MRAKGLVNDCKPEYRTGQRPIMRSSSRNQILASMLALLLLAGNAGCGSTATKTSSLSGGAVPWLDQPLSLYVIPEPQPTRYPTSAPPCRAEQVRVGQGHTAVGLGNELQELVFTNVSARPCLLRGYPTITAETPAGRRKNLHPQRDGTYFGQLSAADLQPGGHVFLDLATSAACEGARKAVRYRHPIFSLPHGGSVRAERISIKEDCGLSMSAFGLPRYPPPEAASGTAGTLQAHLRLPSRARAGATLRYTVMLTNPTKATVVLRPCPGYSEGLYSSGLVVHSSFALNCRSVHAIPARGGVRYVMRLSVPARAAPGIVKIGWSLNTPVGPFAGQVLQLTAG